MRGRESKMPYIHGEPEGLGRKEAEELVEEEKRLSGGPRQHNKEVRGKTKFLPRGVEEVSLEDVGEVGSAELNPDQALELKEAVEKGKADIAYEGGKAIAPENEPWRLDDLSAILAEKERQARLQKRKPKK